MTENVCERCGRSPAEFLIVSNEDGRATRLCLACHRVGFRRAPACAGGKF